MFTGQLEEVKHDPAVCIDESGIKNTIKSECGWSPRGTAVHEDRNSEMFNAWIERVLLQELPKNSVVVLDNASFHKSNFQD